jgi:probable HAF family extracellular repeat protein
MNAFSHRESMRGSRCADGAAGCWRLARQCVLGLTLAMACQFAMAQAMYRITPLGYMDGCTSFVPIAHGFNGADQVTGTACNASGIDHAFLWRNNGTAMVDLTPEVETHSDGVAINESGLVLGNVGFGANGELSDFAFESSGDGAPMRRIYNSLGPAAIQASALNDLGQVTGSAYVGDDLNRHAIFWPNDGSPMLDLGAPQGDGSSGVAINAAGQVTGWSYTERTSQAFVWLNDGSPAQDLGFRWSSKAEFINAFGQVAGTYTYFLPSGAPRFHAYLWRNDGSAAQDLGTLSAGKAGSSYATAFNDSGQIAGYSNSLYVSRNPHAFVWLNDGTPMKDLGTFGGTHSAANAMNFSGQVAGYANLAGDAISHAFLWRNDGTKIQDLNRLIDPADPLKPYVTLTNARFINDKGNILAEGTDSRTGIAAPYFLLGTVITLTPRSLAFGNRPIRTVSGAKSVTMTNTSAKVVAISSIVLKGTNPGQFASTNNCGNSLAGHATCAIQVKFKPTAKGAKSATLNVNGGGGGLTSVSLTGTGT